MRNHKKNDQIAINLGYSEWLRIEKMEIKSFKTAGKRRTLYEKIDIFFLNVEIGKLLLIDKTFIIKG